MNELNQRAGPAWDWFSFLIYVDEERPEVTGFVDQEDALRILAERRRDLSVWMVLDRHGIKGDMVMRRIQRREATDE